MMMSLLHRRDMMTLLRALLLVLHSLSTRVEVRFKAGPPGLLSPVLRISLVDDKHTFRVVLFFFSDGVNDSSFLS